MTFESLIIGYEVIDYLDCSLLTLSHSILTSNSHIMYAVYRFRHSILTWVAVYWLQSQLSNTYYTVSIAQPLGRVKCMDFNRAPGSVDLNIFSSYAVTPWGHSGSSQHSPHRSLPVTNSSSLSEESTPVPSHCSSQYSFRPGGHPQRPSSRVVSEGTDHLKVSLRLLLSLSLSQH